MSDEKAPVDDRGVLYYLTVREAYATFVTKEEHANTMRDLRTDMGEVKGDVKLLVRNQLPPWFLPLAVVVVALLAIVVPHYWK